MTKDIRSTLQASDGDAIKAKKRQLEATIKAQGFGAGFRKPLEVIRMASISPDKEFTLVDRRVLNFLQERVCRELNAEKRGKSAHRGFYEIRISDISKATGANNYSEIRASIERLRSCEVQYNKLEMDEHSRMDEESRHFLGYSTLFTEETQTVPDGQEDGVFRYAFPPGILQMFRKPHPYAYINLSTVCCFYSKFSVALYENLAVFANMDNKTWTVPVNLLADILGWPRREGVRLDFNAFKKRAIDYAVNEINSLENMSQFRVEYRTIPDPMDHRKRTVGSVEFTVVLNYETKKEPKESYKESFNSDIPEKMPQGYGGVGILKKYPKRAAGYWFDFRKDAQEKPADMRSAWEMYVNMRARRDALMSGYNISDEKMSQVADDFGPEIKQTSRKKTWRVLSLIWHVRVKEVQKKHRAGDFRSMSDIDFTILGAINPTVPQDVRDAAFESLIRHESETHWIKSVPIFDDKAADRLQGYREAISAPSAHKSEDEDRLQDDAASFGSVPVESVSRETAFREWAHAPDSYAMGRLEMDAEDHGVDIQDCEIWAIDGFDEARRRVDLVMWEKSGIDAAEAVEKSESKSEGRVDNLEDEDDYVPF